MAKRRGVGLVLTLILIAVLISFSGLLLTYLLVAREPSVPQHATLYLRVEGGLAEMEPGGLIGQFVEVRTVRSVVESLRKAKVDGRVAAVILAPSGESPLWGKVQEIREAIIDFKSSGKPIVAYLQYGGQQEYYVATACDKVFLMPTSSLDLAGVATYEIFLRGMLDKIGAYPDMLHAGEYKTAANIFTERTYTEAHREMAESLNGDLYAQLVAAVAEGRGKTEAEVRALIDHGPFLARDALEAGLVDGLAYEDEVAEQARLDPDAPRIEQRQYRQVSLTSLGLGRGPRIAVIYAVGLINTGRSYYDSPQGPIAGSDTIVEYVRKARDDRSIRAIVLRVDSPGGSAIASDVIWRELKLAGEEKPVIASMSDVAASGGYYIALPASAIVAPPGALTGSIGVVVGKIAVGGTLEKLGLNLDGVSHGAFADLASPVRPFSPQERARLQELVQATYDAFLERAAEGRQTTPGEIDKVARGRVWTGRQARQLGLVDELGGLMRAIALAKERAQIDPAAEVQLVIYPPKPSLFEALTRPFGDSMGARLPGGLLGGEERRLLGTLTAPVRLFRRAEPLALVPVGIWR